MHYSKIGEIFPYDCPRADDNCIGCPYFQGVNSSNEVECNYNGEDDGE